MGPHLEGWCVCAGPAMVSPPLLVCHICLTAGFVVCLREIIILYGEDAITVYYHWLIETSNYAFTGCGYGFSNGSRKRALTSTWLIHPQLYPSCVLINRSICFTTNGAVPAMSSVIGPFVQSLNLTSR